MTVKINTDADPSTSPWHTQPVTGMQVCHYCGHKYEIVADVRKQHFPGCVWLLAFMKEASSNAIHGGPQLLLEDHDYEVDAPCVDEPDDATLKNIFDIDN